MERYLAGRRQKMGTVVLHAAENRLWSRAVDSQWSPEDKLPQHAIGSECQQPSKPPVIMLFPLPVLQAAARTPRLSAARVRSCSAWPL